MEDLISRQEAIDAAEKIIERDTSGGNIVVNAMIAWAEYIKGLPSAESDDWLEKNKDLILQAGMEGREVEFYIDGRLFAIREKPQ